MTLFRLAFAFLLCLIAIPAAAQDVAQAASGSKIVASATSPSKVLQVDVTLSPEGRVGYVISRSGKPVISDSRLGFLFTDAPEMLRNFVFAGQSSRSFDETWEQPWGEYRTIRNRYNELTVSFDEKNWDKRRMSVVFRVFDDGVGFRYALPQQAKLTRANIAEELTEFTIAEPGEAWWDPAFEWNREEYVYNRTPIEQIGTAQTPLTIRTASGLHLSFHEAALVDYSAMNLRRVGGRTLKAVLTPSSMGPKVSRDTPLATPWRVILIAPDAPSLYRSAQIILNLNEPNKIGDVSWFKPEKYVGIWWDMHLDRKTWESGPKHGATTEYTKRMIDFAVKNGFGGVLVEGWNKGWDKNGDYEWFANGSEFSFTEAYPDFDIEELARYAKSKGVGLIGHHETAGNIVNYEKQLGPALDLYQRLGIHAVKTGYVADAGGIQALGPDGKTHFEWHEGQTMVNHHLKVVTEAAKRQIAVNPHEPVKDTGLRRTYPNWVSREGQRGMEYNAWGEPKNPPEHEANLVFTRLIGGPMDFTPGVLSLTGKNNTPILSTLAKQLALYVVIYSPIQMAPDLIENYEANPKTFKFIKDVAVDWDDTRMLAGEVGDLAVFARKARGSDMWFIGAVGDEQERRFDVALDFLKPGKTYRAEIYRDGDDADYRTNQRSIAIEQRIVTAKDRMALRLAPGGGAAVRFVPLR
ncbi:glycoside hydrolase family 97 protein [Sphingomonas daechungensis]|uniref:Glycoside hydrolase family 97 protein n=1 Tax=Sphingomonas daechungensis TaxID=1176646 RepID=A0ABX6T332_9SPHN|nr:glycoside hydrolase family 97 protein [Sphingomonas daechungensis]QNP44286.1 glycoside hydrolase family 97 protein [Sphingomonas daechungensis]